MIINLSSNQSSFIQVMMILLSSFSIVFFSGINAFLAAFIIISLTYYFFKSSIIQDEFEASKKKKGFVFNLKITSITLSFLPVLMMYPKNISIYTAIIVHHLFLLFANNKRKDLLNILGGLFSIAMLIGIYFGWLI